MAESQKGASSITDSKKKSPLHEDDNEQDFFDSWKTTAGGKDVLDFNAEAVPRERKKVFDFGKLDDFELDAEFGKLSSFKMDMSDLDFSSPQEKTEKSKERLGKEAISGKMEGKKDHFSFSFDFNELDAFDLETNMLKGDKETTKCAESDVLDIFENDVGKLSKLGDTNSSNSKDLVSSKMDLDTTDIRTSAPAPEDFEKCNMPQGEALTLQEKQMTITQGGKDESNHSEDEREFQVENPLTKGSENPNAENCVQDFSVQSSDCSPKETIQQSQNAGSSSAIVDAYSGEEKHSTSMRSEDYSESGTNNPAKEYDSKGLTALCIEESMITDDEAEKNQSDQKNIGQSSIIFHDSPKMQKDVGDNSVGPVLNEALPGRRSDEDKWRTSSKVLESSLHGYSKSEQFVAMKENSGLKLLPLNKDQATGSSATTPKQLYAICEKKMETMNLHPANGKSEHGGNHEQGGNHVSGVFKSLNQCLKVGSIAPKSDTNHRDSHTSQPVSSTETTNIRKVASVENCGISLPETDKRHDLSNMNISRNTRSDKYLPNSVMKDTTSVGHSKESMVQHPKTSPLAAHSVTMEKSAALSPPLKRKAMEGSHMDPLTLNSSKRILESPSERRKALHISPRTHGQVGLGSETIGGLYNDIYLDHQNSPLEICVDGNTMGLEVPVSIETDGNIEKVEACAKELETICKMLKKKHEEAKELLVRALVNNNSLLMLDHPIYEEKILALQSFAASLLSKEYDT